MNELILTRIEMLQEELERLKKLVVEQSSGTKKPQKRLKGLWKGVVFSDEEILEAKKSFIW